MKKLAIAFLFLSATVCNATDFKITINDQDALNAVSAIIAANGINEAPEDVIAGLIVPRLVEIRGQQIINAAQAKAQQDPDLLAFEGRQTAKATQIQPVPLPPTPTPTPTPAPIQVGPLTTVSPQ